MDSEVEKYIELAKRAMENIFFGTTSLSDFIYRVNAGLGHEKGAYFILSNVAIYVHYDEDGIIQIDEICGIEHEKGHFFVTKNTVVKRLPVSRVHKFSGKSYLIESYAKENGKSIEDICKEVFG